MTSPLVEFVKEYSLKQPDTGSGTMQITHPSSGVYIGLGAGVSMVQVSWHGKAAVNIAHQPVETSSALTVATIPTSTEIKPRQVMVKLSSENPGNRIFLLASGGGR